MGWAASKQAGKGQKNLQAGRQADWRADKKARPASKQAAGQLGMQAKEPHVDMQEQLETEPHRKWVCKQHVKLPKRE